MVDIVHEGELLIGNSRYRLAGPVVLQAGSRGDATPRRVVLTDTRRGLGAYKQREGLPEETAASIWDGTAETMVAGAITLPPYVNTVTFATDGDNFPQLLYPWRDSVYAVWGLGVYAVPTIETGDFSASIRTLATTPQSYVAHEASGTQRMFLLCGSNIDYVDLTGTWTRITGTDAVMGVTYNNFLWVVGENGAFNRNAAGTDAWGAWTARQSLPLSAGRSLALGMYRQPDGDPAIYAKTETGLYIYDDTNNVWAATDLAYPTQPRATSAMAVWRGIPGSGGTEESGVYVGQGLGVYSYVTGQSGSSVIPLGLDLRDGVPSAYRGPILNLEAAHNYLLALVDARTSLEDDSDYGFISGGEDSTMVLPTSSGRLWIAAWTGAGWHRRWESVSTTNTATVRGQLLVTKAYGKYRAFWGEEGGIYWMDLPIDTLNFREVSTQRFQKYIGDSGASTGLLYPWQFGSDPGNTDTLIRVLCRTSGCSGTETVILGYATNFSASVTDLATISSDGLTTFNNLNLDSNSNAQGVEFDWLQLRVKMARGNTITTRPAIEYLAYDYVPGNPKINIWRVPIDLRTAMGQRSTNGMLLELNTWLNPQDLVPVVWMDQRSASTDVHMVNVVGIEGATPANGWESGIYHLLLQEPLPVS